MSSRISSQPTDGLCYSPTEAKYWDRAGLDKEVERVFDICQGCRLCLNLCPSFPVLFDGVDRNDGDVRGLTKAETRRVVDLCYGCKLCEMKCPYTPRDGHEFQLDFPRLMLRAKSVRAKEEGVELREKLLGNPDLLGKIGSKTPGLANWGCHQKFQRVMMEKLLGIHRDKLLPDFAGETFDKWLKRNPLPPAPAEPAAKVALFPTCFVNYYRPAPGIAAVDVLAKNGCDVKCPKQNCCGMPALDGGEIEFAQSEARANIASMLPLVRQGYKIAAINPTCSLMMRQEYPKILASAEAREFAAAVVDPHEAAMATEAGRPLQPRLSEHARHYRLSRPVPSEGAGNRVSLARSDAHHPGREHRDRRCVHGARWDLGDEERILRALDAGRREGFCRNARRRTPG